MKVRTGEPKILPRASGVARQVLSSGIVVSIDKYRADR